MISIISAVDKNYLIGKKDSNNGLPWSIPEDLTFFKKQTEGKVIIGGRKTFVLMGRALPNRQNIVITNQQDFTMENVIVETDLENLIAIAQNSSDEYFFIGGKNILKQLFGKIDKIYLTHIDDQFEGDTYFPELAEELKKFKLIEKIKGNDSRLSFEIYCK